MPDQEQRDEMHADATRVSQAHLSEVGTEWGTWRPLRLPMFRNLLVADLVSDMGTFMQGVGAAWLMVSQGAGPLLVALTQTASAFPFFLLALPAGALGDIFDRRKLILTTDVFCSGSTRYSDGAAFNYALGAAPLNTCFVDRRCARSADLASGPSRTGPPTRVDAGYCSKRD